MATQKRTFLLFLVASCILSILLLSASTHSQDTTPAKPQRTEKNTTKQTQELDVDQFPILDYANKSTDSRSTANKTRKKYNNRYAQRISESSDTIFSTSDWEVDLPALPIARSAAVIVGEVKQAQAQLSDDETNIYSEFTVQITEVLKNDNKSSLAVGHSVLVERAGGRVRMPSGKVVVARTYKQDLPRIGKRYVFFLTMEEGEDFHVLTGYELRDGMVFPLDKLGPRHPITAYTGSSETTFFVDLNRILVNPLTSQSR